VYMLHSEAVRHAGLYSTRCFVCVYVAQWSWEACWPILHSMLCLCICCS